MFSSFIPLPTENSIVFKVSRPFRGEQQLVDLFSRPFRAEQQLVDLFSRPFRAEQLADLFSKHRAQALKQMPEGSAMLLLSAPHVIRNRDSEYPYRQNSDLYYLTGWTAPEAALLLLPGHETASILFVQPRDPEREVWTGRRHGPEGAMQIFGLDAAYSIKELSEKLPELLIDRHSLYFDVLQDEDGDRIVAKALGRSRSLVRKKKNIVPDTFIHPGKILHELRLRKNEDEIQLMREAARISSIAHNRTMLRVAPGVGEHELEAEILHTFREEGGNGPGYTSIVGSGDNACILHYNKNRDLLKEGDLVLIDAGCEFGLYTADITRTFPVSGNFSVAQRALYDLVLLSQKAAIERIKPGLPYEGIHQRVLEVLTDGLLDLGLLEGNRDSVLETQSYLRFYMHGTTHWLGLDVHDVGAYHKHGQTRLLEPGMVLTVEPGLYIAPDDETVPDAYRGIGIRIEDDVLVTEEGHEVLTAGVPKDPDAIEQLLSTRRQGNMK